MRQNIGVAYPINVIIEFQPSSKLAHEYTRTCIVLELLTHIRIQILRGVTYKKKERKKKKQKKQNKKKKKQNKKKKPTYVHRQVCISLQVLPRLA